MLLIEDKVLATSLFSDVHGAGIDKHDARNKLAFCVLRLYYTRDEGRFVNNSEKCLSERLEL